MPESSPCRLRHDGRALAGLALGVIVAGAVVDESALAELVPLSANRSVFVLGTPAIGSYTFGPFDHAVTGNAGDATVQLSVSLTQNSNIGTARRCRSCHTPARLSSP